MTVDGRARLVLWDVDHTLIDTKGVGRQLYVQAFEAVTGRRMEREADPTGRTEQAIFRETLANHGIEATPDLEARYYAELPRQYGRDIDLVRAKGEALPGASRALEALAERTGVVQTVLSGNFKRVARIKLAAFALDGRIDFEAGAYGEDASERVDLVAIAQMRAGGRYATGFDRANTVIVGDSAGDVRAALDGGAHIVAVASGRDDRAALRRAGATIILEDLTDTLAFMTAAVGPDL
jgi:phosphoglycolate phosphatase-like HAD superfamily hydrolase